MIALLNVLWWLLWENEKRLDYFRHNILAGKKKSVLRNCSTNLLTKLVKLYLVLLSTNVIGKKYNFNDSFRPSRA